MLKRLGVLVCFAVKLLPGWGCEGHQIVARIAEMNLTPRAKAEVTALLSSNPMDPNLVRFCIQGRDDSMADSSTWADDVRRAERTGKWHYMDIPRQVTGGDLSAYCEPVDTAGKGERQGCVLTAIAFNRDILADPKASGAERARALRYLIHFVGDLHQPLHTTDNKDQGGNCDPVELIDAVTISNLHSVWDSGLLEEHLRQVHKTPAEYAALLNQRFQPEKAQWAPHFSGNEDVTKWVWESHAAGIDTTYGAIQPAIPMEPANGATDCNAENAKVYAEHIRLGSDYLEKAIPVIDKELAKAGYRLAALLNSIW
jgi:hypothetical protein